MSLLPPARARTVLSATHLLTPATRRLRIAAAALAAAVFGLCLRCSEDPGDRADTTAEALASTKECPAETVEGIDVFDGQGKIDWQAVAASGVAFAWIKATQGTYDTQATFAANWSGAKAAGILRGAYHFFDPTEDGAAQASHFLEVVSSLEPGDLPPMLDVECPDGADDCVLPGVAGLAAPGDLRARVQSFLRGVLERTAKAPVVYTFESYFAGANVDAAGLERFPLFLAFPTGDSCLDVPAPWAAAAFWQYSWNGKVGGIAGAVDRDRFLGTLATLQAFAAASLATMDAGTDTGVRESEGGHFADSATAKNPAIDAESAAARVTATDTATGAATGTGSASGTTTGVATGTGSASGTTTTVASANSGSDGGCACRSSPRARGLDAANRGLGPALFACSLVVLLLRRLRGSGNPGRRSDRGALAQAARAMLAGPPDTPCRRPTSAKASRFRSTASLLPSSITNSSSLARDRLSRGRVSKT